MKSGFLKDLCKDLFNVKELIKVCFVVILTIGIINIYEKMRISENKIENNMIISNYDVSSQSLIDNKVNDYFDNAVNNDVGFYNSKENLIEEVMDSVVGIAKVKNNGSIGLFNKPDNLMGLGTGFIVSSKGYIATNAHVCGDKFSTCYITLEDGESFEGTVVWADSELDVGVVKIKNENDNLKVVKLGNSDLNRVGNDVYAIGNPIGYEFRKTVTKGIVSAVNRTIKVEEDGNKTYMEDLIQTDATINPGNSGGPLINEYGEVIGINSVKIESVAGIGFAIPINIVKPIVDKFNLYGKFDEPTLGVYVYDKEVVPYLDNGIDIKSGVYVVSVGKNSNSYVSGLRSGDLIAYIDDLNVDSIIDLRRYLFSKDVGDSVVLNIIRNGKSFKISTKLGRR